jgi:hypothetical protein
LPGSPDTPSLADEVKYKPSPPADGELPPAIADLESAAAVLRTIVTRAVALVSVASRETLTRTTAISLVAGRRGPCRLQRQQQSADACGSMRRLEHGKQPRFRSPDGRAVEVAVRSAVALDEHHQRGRRVAETIGFTS